MSGVRRTVYSFGSYGAVVRVAQRFSLPVLGAVSLILVAFSITVPSFQDATRAFTLGVATPLIRAVNAPVDAIAATLSEVSGIATLRAENERLTFDNQRLVALEERALGLIAENATLRELLKMPLDPDMTHVSAPIIGDTSGAFGRSLVIAAGIAQGLERGQPVMTQDGLVGRVQDVGAESSRVMLLTDLNSRLPVFVEGSVQQAIAAGSNHATLTLDFLPEDHDIDVGDRIITSGQGGVFAHGLPVGIVTSVSPSRVEVTPFARADRTRFVRIIDRVEEGGLRTRFIGP